MVGILGYTCYRTGRSIGRVLLSTATVQSFLATLRPPPAWPHCSCQSRLTTQQFSNDALITDGLKKRSWGWMKGLTSPLRTSGGIYCLPCCIEVPVDIAGPCCQRSHDSTLIFWASSAFHVYKFRSHLNTSTPSPFLSSDIRSFYWRALTSVACTTNDWVICERHLSTL